MQAMKKAILLACFLMLKETVITQDCSDRSIFEVSVGQLNLNFFLNIKSNIDGECSGSIDAQYGIIRLEAFLYALDIINSNIPLLHGHTLGAYVFDSCKNPNKAVICSVGDSDSVIANIGPEKSNSVRVGSMIYSSFAPQTALITYGDASEILQDNEQYSNLFQTVPSNTFLADALTDMAVLHNWTFVAVLYSYSNIGSDFLAFTSAASRKGICIKYSASTTKSLSDKFFDIVLRSLKKHTLIQVVYLLLTDTEAKALFRYLSKHQSDFANLQFIGGQHLGTKLSLLSGNHTVDLGLITLEVETPHLPGFKEYFMALHPGNNSRNPFFAEFWEQVFNCSLKMSQSGNRQPCIGNETLSEGKGFFENVPVLPVIDAVLAVSYALSQVFDERCSHLTGSSKETCLSSVNVTQSEYNDTFLQDAIIAKLPSVQFSFLPGRHFRFDSKRWQVLNYSVYNTQIVDSKMTFVKTGTWTYNSTYVDPRFQYKDRLSINSSLIKWRTNSVPVSRCGKECGETEIRVYDRAFPCCWTCKSCGQNSFVQNNTCMICSQWTRSDPVAKKCVPMPVRVIEKSAALPAAIMALLSLCYVAIVVIFVIYIWQFKSRAIKSTSRELSLVSLFGLFLTLSTPLAFLARPSSLVCIVQQCLLGLSLTLCSVPLFLKTFVVYRILKKAKVSTVAPKLSRKRSQIFICAGLITIQILLCALWIQGNPGTVQMYTSADNNHIITHCKYDVVSLTINFAYPCVIMILASVFGLRTATRKLPVVISEGKRIAFASALICFLVFLYLVTFTVYFSDRNSFIQEYSISFIYIIIGAICISLIFLPRICRVLRPSQAVCQPHCQSNGGTDEDQHTVNFNAIQIIELKQTIETQSIQTNCPRCNSITNVVLKVPVPKAD